MIMSTVIGLIRSEAQYVSSLSELLQKVNRFLLSNEDSSMLVTMGLALVNKERQTLTYASAGHLYPYLLCNGRITQIEMSSLPIGIDLEEEFPEKTVSFTEGDLLIL
jgi:sigma-B regulation protein RsbU (phosphoserine phosphatase)